MPSILFLSLMNSDPWGGSEEQWFVFAQCLLQQGFRVAVVSYNWPGKKEKLQPLENAGATIYFLPGRNETQNIFAKWALKKKLNQIPFKNFDWVYVNQGGWKDIAHAPFSNFYKKLPRYMIAYHNYDASTKLSLKKKKLMEAWVAHAAYNLSDANKVFEVFENIFSIKIPRQIVYHNPISFDIPAVPPTFPPLENGNYVWCMLAALYTDRKAQDVLIETLSAQKWKDRNWILNLYGDGKDKEMLQELILKQGLGKKVFLKGHTKNIQNVLANHHLLIQCTRIDAMPITISLAMAMAKPCVVTNVGDMPLWVQDGINGFVCETATIESIDEGLEKCWEKRNEWAEMGKQSFTIFIQKYPQPYCGKFIELLNT
ncbi:MAG: glycosyltransferase family 4 protein [Bacteroidota bacterium]